MIQEYVASFGLKAVINRCGVIAGPGQWGKTDQGVFTLWVANHYFNQPLHYTGFGGTGKQVRDLLHPDDLFELLLLQQEHLQPKAGAHYNVGGGLEASTSLLEMTERCQRVTGNRLQMTSIAETAAVDVPYYVTCNDKVHRHFGWSPQIRVEQIVEEIYQWLLEKKDLVTPLFTSTSA